MKFVIAALLGLVSASTIQAEVRQDQILLRDELKSLLELVQSVETKEQSEIFDTIEVRKEVLKSLAGEMPERKAAIANEVTNLTNVVSKVLEEDFEGAITELEARKDELVDIHEYLQSLDEVEGIQAGTEGFSMVKTTTDGADPNTGGVSSITFKADKTINGGTNWGIQKYDDTLAEHFTGTWSEVAIANPDEATYGAAWNAETNVHWEQNGTYYSGVLTKEALTGVFNTPGTSSSGTFVSTVMCDWKCQGSDWAATAGDVIGDGISKGADLAKEGAEKFKKALKGENGLAIGLGSVAGLLAVCAMCYCYCKKDKGVMSEGSEGGQKQSKESLLVHTEEA